MQFNEREPMPNRQHEDTHNIFNVEVKASTSIVPSARKGIHSLSSLNNNRVDMGRYGLSKQRHNKETDEVDNVMSKPIRAHSPLPTRRKEEIRRKSLTHNQSNELLTEDNVLSQSLPASFLSSYCSDNITDEEADQEEVKQYHNDESCISHNYSSAILIAIVAVIVMTIYYSWTHMTMSYNNAYYDQIMFSNDIKILGEKYNMDVISILQVQSGITTIFENEDSGSFTFVYNSKSSKYNKNNFENFINNVASTSAKYLRNDTTEVSYIVLENSDLKMKNDSELINKYRKQVEKTGVMLVKELENLPSNLAMAFHYFCDEYNPLVKKSAIIFTLDLGKCAKDDGKSSSHAVVENCLKDKWRSVPTDNIGPLLTRVVNVVVDVYSIF